MSMQSRRLVAGALALTLLALLLIACAGDGTATTPVQQAQQPALAALPQPAAPAPEPQPVSSPQGTAVQPGRPAPASPPPAPPSQPEPQYGGIAVFANRGDPPGSWDPMLTSTLTLHSVSGSIYGSGNLAKLCRGNVYEVCPALAEKWESNSDFTEWTFKIRDTVLWHDGKSFTADDAKFWVELAFFGVKIGAKSRVPSIFKADFGDLKKAEVLPGNRLRLTLEHPVLNYPIIVGFPRFAVAHPPHLMRPRIEGGEVNVTPADVGWVATGAFKLLKYERGSRIQVRRFDQYWEKDEKGRRLPFLEGIDFPIIQDPSAMDAAFRVGRLDGGGWGTGGFLTKERQAGYIRDLGDKVWFAEIAGNRSGVGFNVLKSGPQQDVRVRRAVALWLDKEAQIALRGGFGYLHPLLHPKNPYSNPDFMTWPGWNPATRERDKAEAKRLLAEAGYPKGFLLDHPCRRITLDECQYLQGQLAGLGIELKLGLFDDVTFLERIRTSTDYAMLQVGIAGAYTLPEQTEIDLAPYSVSKYGAGKHEDQKIVELFARLKATTSFDERVNIWRQLERYYLLEQVYAVPVAGILAVVPYRSHVKGKAVPTENTFSDLDFATVWLDK